MSRVIFVLGLIVLVMEDYARMGYWVCFLMAVSLCICLYQGFVHRKRKKELITRLREIAAASLSR